MDRRGFLKSVGLGGLAVVAAPTLALPAIRSLVSADPERRFFLPPSGGWPRTSPVFNLGDYLIESNGDFWTHTRSGDWTDLIGLRETTYTFEGFYDPSFNQFLKEYIASSTPFELPNGAHAYVTDAVIEDNFRVRVRMQAMDGEPIALIKRGERLGGMFVDSVDIDSRRDHQRLYLGPARRGR